MGNRSRRDMWPIARALTFTLSVMGAIGRFQVKEGLDLCGFFKDHSSC